MIDDTRGRGVVIAAAAMVIVGQLLAIMNDVLLKQNDPADLVLLAVLLVLAAFMLRRAGWARWAMVVLATLSGLLLLASVVLLIATTASPGFWSSLDASMPALRTLHQQVVAFVASPDYVVLTASVLVSGILDVVAAGMLVFARSVRDFFARGRSASAS